MMTTDVDLLDGPTMVKVRRLFNSDGLPEFAAVELFPVKERPDHITVFVKDLATAAELTRAFAEIQHFLNGEGR